MDAGLYVQPQRPIPKTTTPSSQIHLLADHGLQHLCGTDDKLASAVALCDHHFLSDRDLQKVQEGSQSFKWVILRAEQQGEAAEMRVPTAIIPACWHGSFLGMPPSAFPLLQSKIYKVKFAL